jgi:hypothetical protein
MQDGSAQSTENVVERPKTTYLELYVNSKDPKHFNAIIERAVRLQQSNVIPISAVYHIGDFNSVTPDIQGKLWRTKLKLFALSGVPSDLPITTSPAWVFVTRGGRRIVEGATSIESFIDDSGEFRDGSHIRDPLAVATPELGQKMEGF